MIGAIVLGLIFLLFTFLMQKEEKISFFFLLTFFAALISGAYSFYVFNFPEKITVIVGLIIYTLMINSITKKGFSVAHIWIPFALTLQSPSLILLGLFIFLSLEKKLSHMHLLLVLFALLFSFVAEYVNQSPYLQYFTFTLLMIFLLFLLYYKSSSLITMTTFISLIKVSMIYNLSAWSYIVFGILVLALYIIYKTEIYGGRAITVLKCLVLGACLFDVLNLQSTAIFYLVLMSSDLLEIDKLTISTKLSLEQLSRVRLFTAISLMALNIFLLGTTKISLLLILTLSFIFILFYMRNLIKSVKVSVLEPVNIILTLMFFGVLL